MPILKFKSPDGTIIKVNSPDGSMPSEGDLDQLFSKQKALQGGANSPALVKARGDVDKARSATDSLDTDIVGANFANARLLGIPGIAAKALNGSTIPEPTTSGGKLLSDLATGAGVGLAVKPTLKLLGIPVKAVSDIKKFSNPDNRIDLAQETRNAAAKAKDDLMDTYGGEYERIVGQSDKKIKTEGPISNFMEDSRGLMNNQEFRQDLKLGNPNATKIQNLIDQFGKENFPKELPAKDANEISKYIKTIPSIKTKLSKPPIMRDFTNEERILLNLSNDFKESVINEHPDLQSLNEHYAETINDLKSIRMKLKPNETIEKLKDYSNWDDEFKKSFERQIPSKTVGKIKDFEKSQKAFKLLKSLGMWGARGAATAAGFKGIGH